MNSASVHEPGPGYYCRKMDCVCACVCLTVCLSEPIHVVMSILKVLLALTLSDAAEIPLRLPCYENSVYLVAREACFFSAGHSEIYSSK